MKKIIYFLFMLLFCVNISQAQVSSYSFGSSSGTYTEMTSGATLLPLMRADTYTSPAQNIGFTFNYGGADYTQFVMSSNGLISLNPTATSLTASNDFSVANATSRPIIAPLWDDLDGAGPANSVGGYEVSGVSPNRVLTIEWRNWEWNWLSTTAVISFQIKLYETTNVIQFVYRQEATAVNTGTASIGIGSSSGSGVGTFLNVTADLAATTSTLAVNNIATKPATGQTYTFTPPACSAPGGLVVTNISTLSATLTWSAVLPAPTGYEYVVKTASALPVGAGTSVTTNTVNVSGLNPVTTYNVFLRKVCGSEFSSWTLAGTFNTPCPPISSLPWVESFDTTATGTNVFPPCWGFENLLSTWAISTTPTPTHSGLNLLRRTWSTNGWAFTPIITLTAGTVYQFSYWVRANDTNSPGYSIDTAVGQSQNIAGMTTILDSKTGYTNNVWSRVTTSFMPTSTGAYTFGVRAGVPTSEPNGINFDDFKVEIAPSCIEPGNIVASNISSSTATVSWSVPVIVPTNGYQYFISTVNTAPNVASLASGVTAAGIITTNFTGLLSNTLYYVWVRSICSASDSSSWTPSISFKTLCSPQTEFVENFDSYPSTGTAFYADCWGKSNMTGSVYLTTGGAAPGTAPNRLYMNCSATTTAVAVMPAVSNLQANTHRLIFKAYASVAAKTIDVGYLTNPADIASFVVVQNLPLPITAATALAITVIPTGISAGISSLAFRITGSATTVYIDDVKWEINSTCVEPNGLIATSITTNSAQIDWNEPTIPAANGYEYLRSISSTTPLNSATPTGTVGAGLNSVILNGLSSSTKYYVWIRSKCSPTDNSPWSNVLTFTTLCNSITTFPWTENFDTTATGTNVFPPCWSFENITSTWAISTTPAPFSGVNLLRRTWSTNGWAFTPTMTLTAGTSYDFSYWTKANDTNAPGYTIQTAVGESQTAAGMITTLDTKTNYVNAVWAKVKTTFVPTTTGVYTFGVRAEVPTSEPNGINFDDFKVELSPTCVEPTAVVSSAVSTSTATVSWTAPLVEPANGYQYYMSTSNVAPNVASFTGNIPASLTTYILTGLAPSTVYYIWIRSVCSASDRSSYAPPISFTTLCNPIATLPWLENFDTTPTGTNVFPPCWSFENIASTWAISTTPAPAFSGANLLRRTWSTNGWAFTPSFDLTAGTAYEFSYYMRANDNTAPGYIIQTAVGSTQSGIGMTTTLDTKTGYVNSVWAKVTTTFVPATSGIYIFGVRAEVATSAPNGINFDDFKVQLAPTCITPSSLAVSAITATTATVSWTAPPVAPANGYEYFISTTSTAPLATATPTGSVAAGTTSVNLTLNSSTNYYIWVRSNCSTTDKSEWSAATNFSTLCLAVTTFFQNFDAATTFPTCWSKVGTPGSANIQASSSSSAPNCLYIYGTSVTAQPVVAMTPVSNAGAGTHWLRFKMRANVTVAGVLEVGYLTNPSDITTFVPVQSYLTNSTTVYQTVEANLGTAPGNNQVLAFRALGSPANSILIDDVSWEALPTCASPTALVATAITTTTATISWTAPTSAPANGYEYFLSTSSTAPSLVATPTGTIAAGITTINLTPLTSSTPYFIWVRSICSAVDKSNWSNVLNFATTCAPVNVPYSEDFESAVVPNMPACTTVFNAGTGNNWTVVANNAYGFTSKTLRYQWNVSSAANAWFFTNGINLTAGVQYKLNYRYGGSSTTYVENLKVAYGTVATVAGMTNPLADHPGINTATAINAPQVTFTPSTTGVYFFGFNAYSALNQFYLLVDDIAIDTVLSNNTFDNASFSYYPNPVKEILNLDYNQNITNVSVFNLLGQQVITKTVNANQSKIDMSNLSAGTYLVKVTADNQTKTIKVIKE